MLTNGVGDPSYARGGNGIFGDAKAREWSKKLYFVNLSVF
jgi:hypothetical protein